MLEKNNNITIKMMDGLGPRGGGGVIYIKSIAMNTQNLVKKQPILPLHELSNLHYKV